MKGKIYLTTAACICSFLFSGCRSNANGKNSSNTNKTVANVNATTVAANNVENTAKPAASPVDPKFNAANFNKLETGMKYAEVVKILGSEGKIDGSTGLTGGKTVMYKWTDASGAFVKVIFQNDMLLDKVQTGLR